VVQVGKHRRQGRAAPPAETIGTASAAEEWSAIRQTWLTSTFSVVTEGQNLEFEHRKLRINSDETGKQIKGKRGLICVNPPLSVVKKKIPGGGHPSRAQRGGPAKIAGFPGSVKRPQGWPIPGHAISFVLLRGSHSFIPSRPPSASGS
jgi:hypothetical protein